MYSRYCSITTIQLRNTPIFNCISKFRISTFNFCAFLNLSLSNLAHNVTINLSFNWNQWLYNIIVYYLPILYFTTPHQVCLKDKDIFRNMHTQNRRIMSPKWAYDPSFSKYLSYHWLYTWCHLESPHSGVLAVAASFRHSPLPLYHVSQTYKRTLNMVEEFEIGISNSK